MIKDYYLSSDGKTKIAYFIYETQESNPKAVLQIAHGMKESLTRYQDFAHFFNQNGIIVVGNDALGHGETSVSKETDGFFADKNGDKCVVEDLHTMTRIAKEKYPNLPIFMLGFSMGSFFARLYASIFPTEINGFIFCGTSYKISGTRFGLIMMNVLKKIKGARTHFEFIDNIMTDKYFRYIPHPQSKYEWVTSDVDFLKKSSWDDKVDMPFSVGAYYDMVKTLCYVNTKKWAKKLYKNTPVLLISGAQDPVGQYGNGVCKVYNLLEREKLNDLELVLYGTARHTLFYEVENIKNRFYNDLLNWISNRL